MTVYGHPGRALKIHKIGDEAYLLEMVAS